MLGWAQQPFSDIQNQSLADMFGARSSPSVVSPGGMVRWSELADPGSKDSRLRITVIALWETHDKKAPVKVQTLAGPPVPAHARILEQNDLSVAVASNIASPEDVQDLMSRHPDVAFIKVAWFDYTPNRSKLKAAASVSLVVNDPGDGASHAVLFLVNQENDERRHIIVPLAGEGTASTVSIMDFPSCVSSVQMRTVRVNGDQMGLSNLGPEHRMLIEVDQGQNALFVVNRCGPKPCHNTEDILRY